ncbi:MAG: FkbM family methyltransferase [Vicinamibacterales bacterium]
MDVFIDPRFDEVYRRHPLVLIDVGARGGLKSNWEPARRHLHLVGFEPDKKEFGRLVARSDCNEPPTTFFDVALHDRAGRIQFNIARDRGLSSIFEPNRDFLDSFPDSARFDVIENQLVEADALDNQLRAHGVDDVDFIKADTQGSELFVLQGAARALASFVVGLEVEVEFAPIYRGQPLFADVDRFLQGLGYLLFDLRPCYWKRSAGLGMGGPRGQIVWADALYLRSLPALRKAIAGLDPALRRAKLLRALTICLLYGYCDYALEIVREAGDALAPDDRAVVERRLRESSRRRGLRFPGRRHLAAALHRLWKLALQPDDAWSVSRATLGNQE